MLLLQFSVFCFQKCYYILVCVSFALFYLIVIQVCKFVYFLKFGKSPVIISSSCLPSPCIPVLFWITRWYTTNLLGSMCCFWKKIFTSQAWSFQVLSTLLKHLPLPNSDFPYFYPQIKYYLTYPKGSNGTFRWSTLVTFLWFSNNMSSTW